MAEERKNNTPRTKRVFINHIDSYTSKYIAKFLSTCIVGASLEEQVEEEEKIAQDHPTLKDGTFQIVGTIADQHGGRSTFAVDEYFSPTRVELLHHLMDCEVVVYNITESANMIDEATWAISALHSEIENFLSPKMFILVSTLMSWAMTKPADPDDPEMPLTEDDTRRRRPHPNFKEHASAERLVLKLGKTKRSKLATYVVTAGLQYGMGEEIFHYFFKMAWHGEMSSIPVFGPGTNIIPTIHVNDLAGVVQNIIDHKPKIHYFIAVDDSKNTSEDIVKAIAHVLGPGKTMNVPKEDAHLTEALTQTELDFLTINLRFEPVLLKDTFNLQWICESGIVENINLVVDEYKQTRQLQPIRIFLHGPPAVGKTSVAAKLCKHYKLHHVKVEDAVEEKIANLERMLQMTDKDEANEQRLQEAQDTLEKLKDNLAQNDGKLDDLYVFGIIKEKLNSKPCRNQGFVLDGYPETYEQAKELFYDEDLDMEDTRFHIKCPYNKNITPEYVFSINAPDDFLKERVQSLPQSVAEEMGYTQEEFLRHLAKFRDADMEDETVLSYFDELEIHPEYIEIKGLDNCENLAVVEKIVKTVGRCMNYGLTTEEQQEQETRRVEERRQQLLRQTAERELRQAEEEARMAALLEEWSRNVTEVRKQEHEMLETRSMPIRHYLMRYVMPTLAQGMADCCKAKSDDPVNFLAEYLFRNNADD